MKIQFSKFQLVGKIVEALKWTVFISWWTRKMCHHWFQVLYHCYRNAADVVSPLLKVYLEQNVPEVDTPSMQTKRWWYSIFTEVWVVEIYLWAACHAFSLRQLTCKALFSNWFNCLIVCPFWGKSDNLGFYLIRGKLHFLQTSVNILYYWKLIEMRNEFFDLIGWEAVRTWVYRPAYGSGNALTQ